MRSEDEIVWMLCGRPKDEFSIFLRIKVDRLVRRLEGHEFAGLDVLGNGNSSSTERDPTDCVNGGRLIAPGLASIQAHS
jgi:hypothetical protein